MTKPNDMITITKDDIEISLPISALQYYDKVVELAHLVILGDAVPERAGAEAIAKLKEAMASGNPLEALRKLKDQVKGEPPAREDLKAEVIEKGEEPKSDPMVRIAEVAMKCAESIGVKIPKGTPVVQMIPAIAAVAAEYQKNLTDISGVVRSTINDAGMGPFKMVEPADLLKSIQNLGTGLKQHMGYTAGGWKALKVMRDTMGSLGIRGRDRPQGSLEQCIQDCQEALSLAARRGVTLKSGPEGVKS